MAGRPVWCERIKVAAGALRPLPEAADTLQLAMMAVNPATAWLMLKSIAPLEAGAWVIQNAGNSGVGHCVVALARQMGARTISLVRRPEQVEALRARGADVVLVDDAAVIDAVRAATAGSPIMLALDAVAGEATGRLARCLADGGTVVTYGRLSAKTSAMEASDFIFRGLVHRGFWLGRWLATGGADARAAMYDEIARLIVDGVIRVDVEATYPLARVRDALAHAARPGRRGKILLVVNE
jgi:NADPH:quinone reductase-like Zn-dependent oxidoreductase